MKNNAGEYNTFRRFQVPNPNALKTQDQETQTHFNEFFLQASRDLILQQHVVIVTDEKPKET
jgi:hypothetical protein